MRPCGCEEDQACTRTTLCALESAVEDKVEEIYWDINAMGGRATDAKSIVQMAYLDEILAVLEKHR